MGKNVVIQVKLDKMVQKNKTTGWERRIRCCLKDGDGKNEIDYLDKFSILICKRVFALKEKMIVLTS